MRAIFPLAIALAMTLATTGASQPALAQDSGATVTKDLGCGGFIPNPDGSVGEIIYTSESAVLIKGNGTTSLSCHFTFASDLAPKTTTRAEGFACYTFLGLTYDSRMQASSGGNATLSCRIRTK